jgi:hypothetical protein
MKTASKLILSSIVFFSLISCEKTNSNSPNESSNVVNTAPNNTAKTVGGGPGYNSEKMSSGMCYKNNIKDCVILPEIIVTPHRLINLSNGGTPAQVAEAFASEELRQLADQLPESALNLLLSGTCYIHISYESNSLICFQAGTSYPVTVDNSSFAFQFSK